MANLKYKELIPAPQTGMPHSKHVFPPDFKRTTDMYTNTVGRGVGEAVNFYGKVIDNPIAERVTNGILQKGWRALLFLNRAGVTHKINRLGSKTDFQGDNITGELNTTYGPSSDRTEKGLYNQLEMARYNNPNPRIFVGHDIMGLLGAAGKRSDYNMGYTDLLGKSKSYDPADLNQVIIYNLSEVTNGDPDPFIALQIRPYSIESRAETSWAAIKSMGRNSPMYHYLGAEDSLQINTSWYIKGKPGDPGFNPYWVINQCRRLKAWSMANGYIAGPPILRIQWGRADIFKDELWILSSATYHLGNFSDKVVVKHNSLVKNSEMAPQKEVELIDAGLVPFTATQELIFKRVSSHSLLSQEIYNYQEPENSEV